MSDALDIQPLIEALLHRAKSEGAGGNSGYRYPLASPTYGSEEVMEALDSLCSYKTTMWEKTRRFEDAFGGKYGGEAVMVNSGSSADLLIAFGLHERSGGPLKSGDEVIVPAVTWPTQLWSLLMAGYRVRLVDVDPLTLNVNLHALSEAVSERTRAISLVHLMGNPVDMDFVVSICREKSLVLFEDCCESLGAKWDDTYVGRFGVAAAFSFFFSHHLTTMEGGMITTRDPEFAERLRLLRAHGWSRNLKRPPESPDGLDPRYTFLNWGFNVRPTELQAGFGLVQLGKADNFQGWRNRNASIAVERLRNLNSLSLMSVPERGSCSWFALPILVSEQALFSRDELTEYLEAHGIETRPIVTGNLARHPALEGFKDLVAAGELPGAEAVHNRGFYLGLHPVDNSLELEAVFDLIDRFIDDHS